MEQQSDAMKAAGRRYLVEFGGAMAAYTVLLIVSVTVLQAGGVGGWRYAIALLPVIPLPFGILAFLRLMRKMDELQRRIQLEAIGFAFGTTMLITITMGFLENAGLPRMSWIWVTPLMIALWSLGRLAANRHYR
jgi:hypothetical protein